VMALQPAPPSPTTLMFAPTGTKFDFDIFSAPSL